MNIFRRFSRSINSKVCSLILRCGRRDHVKTRVEVTLDQPLNDLAEYNERNRSSTDTIIENNESMVG
jgi:hypothetical protein